MVLPIYDDHFHVSPSGLNVEAMKQFKAAGGTGMTLVTLPYSEVQITCGEDFRRSFEITVRYAEMGRELGLKINCAIGPYPILLIPLAEHYGMEKAEQILMEGMDIAHEMITSGKAQLMGEVGRPHFEADQKYFDSCNRVLQYGMDLAHENDYAVMIHCESWEDTYRSLASMANPPLSRRDGQLSCLIIPLHTRETETRSFSTDLQEGVARTKVYLDLMELTLP